MGSRLRPLEGRATAWRASPERLAQAFVLLVCASVLGLSGWRAYLAHDLALQDSRTATANLARALADHAGATVQAADILTAGLVERLEAEGTAEPALARLHRMMVARVAAVPAVRELVVYAADGSWLASSFPANPPGGNNGDRAYFVHHRAHADRAVHIGPPVRSRATGRWIISVTRRFDQPDGSFGGVAFAMLDFATFEEFYRSFDIGAGGSIALLNDDGTLLVRVPPAPESIGRDLAGVSFFREYRERGPIGNARGVSQLDGVLRLTSFRRVDAYPLVVFVARSEADILASWRRGTWVAAVAASAIALALGVLGWRLAGQIRLRHRAELAVQGSERQLRLLADHSTDLIIQLGPDFRRVYVSPASERLLGFAPAEMLGLHPRELAHPEDWPQLALHLASEARDGTAPPITYRARRRDGTYIWVEAVGRRLDCGVGSVAVLRDVTRRREAEEQLHQANNRLQRMVMLDGLTGIANRRCFDSALGREFRRAARAELPLGLLLLDVDRFKAYNDTYGHPAGDACLQAIAKAVEGAMLRPADLAARYGGEEFAVLLPETDSAGAMALAERVRRAVRELGIAHAGNTPGVATISIGVAVTWPQHAGLTAAALLGLADAALYRAKTTGRDRVCLATPAPVLVEGGLPTGRSPDRPAGAAEVPLRVAAG